MKCYKCGVELTSENYKEYRLKKKDYICNDCSSKKSRDWYRNHPEKLREYYGKNREKILKYHIKYHRLNRPSDLKKGAEYYEKIRKQVLKTLGEKCYVCGVIPRTKMNFHEVHGRRHPSFPIYVLKHLDDFVCLCQNCHRAIHKYHKFKCKFEELERRMD